MKKHFRIGLIVPSSNVTMAFPGRDASCPGPSGHGS
jgi:hypothetical protein